MLAQSGRLILVLVILMAMLPAAVGCRNESGEDSASRDNKPFYTDRVVTVRITMEEEDWEFTKDNALAEQYVRADLWYDGELIPDVAVRPKGNSSLTFIARYYSSIRYSFKVDLNFFNSARNLYGVKKLCFNNGISDPSFIRETLGYELFRQMDIPTPSTSFVDLWVNDTHLGLYTMVEAIDKTFLSEHFADNTGNLYKPEMPAAYLNWTEEDYEKQQSDPEITGSDDRMDETDVNLGGGKLLEIMQALESGKTGDDIDNSNDIPTVRPGAIPPGGIPRLPRLSFMETMGLKTNENKPDHSLLFRFLEILNNEPDETFPVEIEKVLDVDGTLRYLAVSALIVHLDNYIAMGHNYYLYDYNGRFVIIPWDLNMAFGTFEYGLDRGQLINYYIDEPSGGPMEERPLVGRLLSYQPYLDVYHGYLEELLDGPFSIDNMNSRIDELASLIRPFAYADKRKFFSTEQFEEGFYKDITRSAAMGSFTYQVLGLKPFVAERVESVTEQLQGKRKSSYGDGSGNRGSFNLFPNLPPRDRQLPRKE